MFRENARDLYKTFHCINCIHFISTDLMSTIYMGSALDWFVRCRGREPVINRATGKNFSLKLFIGS